MDTAQGVVSSLKRGGDMETRGSELHPSMVAPKPSDRPKRPECSQRFRATAFNRQAARNCACIQAAPGFIASVARAPDLQRLEAFVEAGGAFSGKAAGGVFVKSGIEHASRKKAKRI